MKTSDNRWHLPDSIEEREIGTPHAFNSFCRDIIMNLRELERPLPASGDDFQKRYNRIQNVPENIRTDWGGVDIVSRKDPEVEKYLVVKGGTWLAYEKHSEKQETLILQEGLAVLLHRRMGAELIECNILELNQPCYLAPGEEHCLIAVSDTLVFEKSLDYRGMDNDLIFLQLPDTSLYLKSEFSSPQLKK